MIYLAGTQEKGARRLLGEGAAGGAAFSGRPALASAHGELGAASTTGLSFLQASGQALDPLIRLCPGGGMTSQAVHTQASATSQDAGVTEPLAARTCSAGAGVPRPIRDTASTSCISISIFCFEPCHKPMRKVFISYYYCHLLGEEAGCQVK